MFFIKADLTGFFNFLKEGSFKILGFILRPAGNSLVAMALAADSACAFIWQR
jgi:hypothetical protein